MKIVFGAIILLGFSMIMPVYAIPDNLIGIQLSQVCLTEIKNHLKTDCPTYQDLVKYDNTNQKAYGKFTDANGFYHRTKPLVPNYYSVLDPKKTIIAVDPENNFIINAKMIIIEPKDFTFINKDEVVNDTHVRLEYHGRSVFECNTATIAYSDFLVNDTISYLDSGCTKTAYVDHSIIKTPNTPFSFNNPYSSLHQDTYLQSIFHGHKTLINEAMPTGGGLGPSNCINTKCNYKDPSAKW